MSGDTGGNRNSDTMGGDALGELMEKPQAMLNSALTALSKKAMASMVEKAKLFLATGTEPFFRKGMGERYFSAERLNGGVVVWIIATAIALYLPGLRSAGAWICWGLNLYWLTSLFMSYWFTLITGGVFLVAFYMFGKESLGQMAKFRAEGVAYHSLSRGTPRWEGDRALVPLGIFIVLVLFDMPAAIVFLASCMARAKLAGEQQAAIWSRYMDALDQKIEQEYLEKAILGQCPTEITQLCKPLPADMNSDLRDNVAAAAVGKTVKIVVKAASRAGTPAQS